MLTFEEESLQHHKDLLIATWSQKSTLDGELWPNYDCVVKLFSSVNTILECIVER